MEAKLTTKKTLQLTENGLCLGELNYNSLFSLKAKIKLANSDLYEINPVGILLTSIAVTKNGIKVANLEMNWSGQIVLSFQGGQQYALKPTGMFQNKFALENKEQEPIIQLSPKFNWAKVDYNYEIVYDRMPQDNLLTLLSIYASNYYMTCTSGSR